MVRVLARNGVSTMTDKQDNQGVLLREERGPVAVLTLNRPEMRNCLSHELLAALNAAFADISASGTVKAVVVASNGPVFSAGHDIREMQSHREDADKGKAFFARMFSECSVVMQAIVDCPKPVVAAVEGTATAAGCQLVATCDLAVAADDAKFCTPGVHIGLFCSTPAVAVARNVGRKRAMEMLLLGEMVDAEDACAYGLVNKIVPKNDVMRTAMELAELIASKSAAANAIGKKTFYEQVSAPLGLAYDRACEAMVENMMLADANEGLGAFLEKRKPQWRDR
jgi:enoyl-CoA hydratase/carnithine racemase